MDAANFERVYDGFQQFHAFFAPAFGRKQWRERSRNYLQALLVQAGERRNAENLSETVPGSARGMQRFLTDSPWDDEAIIGRLQEYLGQPVGCQWHRDIEPLGRRDRVSIAASFIPQ